MTVQDQTISTGAYAGNDIADTFAFSWKITSNTQLVVGQTDNTVTPPVTTTLVLNTDYTVSGVGDEGGGSVILTTPLPTNNTLQIKSNFVPTQETEFSSQGSFLPENHEDAFDKLTRLIQQLIYEGDFTLSFNSNQVFNTFNPSLPDPNVAGGYLRIKQDLSGLEWTETSFDPTTPIDFTNITVNGDEVVTVTNIFTQAGAPVTNATTAFSLDTTMQSVGVVTTNALAVTVTIEPNSTTAFPVGAVVPIYQNGEGQVTIVAGLGVTLEYKLSEGAKISERYAFATAWQRATDVWVLSGSLSA
jgi:hypothetical protein